MQAGRELDIAVAEKVMGWTRERISKAEPYITESGGIGHDLPLYSTDIAAAWDVLDKVVHGRSYWSIRKAEDSIECGLMIHDESEGVFYQFRAKGQDTAHAICLAALKAVEGR